MIRVFCLLALAIFAPAVRGDLIFQASLLPGNEVPPHVTPAFGFITVDLHSNLITLDVSETFDDLTNPASAAHIHCCAPPSMNAPVVLPFTGFPAVTTGTYNHTFDLNTDLTGITAATFVAQLESGNTYANIHDATFPGGEIRGQLEPVPEPGSVILLTSVLGILGLAVYRKAQDRLNDAKQD